MPEKYRRPHSHERIQAVERMKLAWEAERDAVATVRRFNAKLSTKGYSAKDQHRDYSQTSLASHCLRQLRYYYRFGFTR
jgi:hypothetical protein